MKGARDQGALFYAYRKEWGAGLTKQTQHRRNEGK
jgi:hypothetical protein